jgi:hypothetical protein
VGCPDRWIDLSALRLLVKLAFLDGLTRTASVKAEQDESCVIVLRRDELKSFLPRLNLGDSAIHR